MKVELAKGVYWVGAVDWNIREFHSYSLHHNTTYNAYLIVDDKVVLVDTVKPLYYQEMFNRINEIVSLTRIDYVIANHAEMDHSGSLPLLMKDAPQATVITSRKFGELGLAKHFHHNWKIMPVGADTAELPLGKRALKFIPMPMLHWPDSMATYLKEDAILFSNDAFGQHFASSKRFDDQIDINTMMSEAEKYYATVLMPFGKLIVQAVQKLRDLKIKMIAPSHGIIWRSFAQKIMDLCYSWGSGETEKRALVVYDTMWASTEKMALSITEGISAEGVPVQVFDVTGSDRSDIIGQLLTARAIIIGCSTLNNGVLPNMAAFLSNIKGLKPANKIGAAFGSYGWAGGAVKTIEDILKEIGADLVQPAVSVQFVPEPDDLKRCYEFGRTIAQKISAET